MCIFFSLCYVKIYVISFNVNMNVCGMVEVELSIAVFSGHLIEAYPKYAPSECRVNILGAPLKME